MGGGGTGSVGGGTGLGAVAGGSGNLAGADVSFQRDERLWLVSGGQLGDAVLQADGGVDAWRNWSVSFSGLPLRRRAAAAVNGDVVYLVGGNDGVRPTANVYAASLGASPAGSVLQFAPLGPLPIAVERHAAVVFGGELLVLAGYGQGTSTWTRLSSVYGAPILADGGLGPWRSHAPLPTPRTDHAVGVRGDTVYCIGGEVAPDASVPEVLSARFEDGGLTGWRAEAPIQLGRTGHGLLARDGRLVVFGGEAGGQAFFDVQIAEFDGGVLSGWRFGLPMQASRTGAHVFSYAGNVVVMGGVPGLSIETESFRLLPNGDLQR